MMIQVSDVPITLFITYGSYTQRRITSKDLSNRSNEQTERKPTETDAAEFAGS